MKRDYEATIQDLKEKGYINSGDKFAFCYYVPKTDYRGAVTVTTYSKVDYIIIANDDEVKILDVDKKTGEYLGTGVKLKKELSNYANVSRGPFGGRYFGIRADYADAYSESYKIPKKFHGFLQEERGVEFYNFIKEVYMTYYKERKLQQKEEKRRAKEEKKNKPF